MARSRKFPPGARRAELPARIRPLLPTLAAAPPAGDDFLHEIKFDGWRAGVRLEGGRVAVFTREGHEITSRLQALVAEIRELRASDAWLDGELVALEPTGRPSFALLQERMAAGRGTGIHLVAFDLLHLDGHDLRGVAIEERKALLRLIVEGSAVRFSAHVVGSGEEYLRQACELGVEGVVSKRVGSTYAPGRSRAWVKVKCPRIERLVVCGFIPGRRRPSCLVLARRGASGDLEYVGRVNAGLQNALDAAALELLVAHVAPSPTLDVAGRSWAPRVRWMRPAVEARITLVEWTRQGRLRHPILHSIAVLGNGS